MGGAGWRDQIFRRELPLVLEAFRYGERELLGAQPHLDKAPVVVHFHSSRDRYDQVETWGTLSNYA